MKTRTIYQGELNGQYVKLQEWGPEVPGIHKVYSHCSGEIHAGEDQPMVSGYSLLVANKSADGKGWDGGDYVDICYECMLGKNRAAQELSTFVKEYECPVTTIGLYRGIEIGLDLETGEFVVPGAFESEERFKFLKEAEASIDTALDGEHQ